jgi:hypothetical protein
MPSSRSLHTLTIGHGNGHNETSLVRLVEFSGCSSFGCAEADRLLPQLRALEHYETFVGGETRCPGEVPILVRRSHEILGHHAHQISDAIPGLTRVAPDRWATQVRYRHPLAKALGFKGVAHIAWHPDAGPKQLNGHNPDAPIVREYRAAENMIVQDIKHARAQGYLVVVTGDLQMTDHADQPWAPSRVYGRLNLATYADRIDWIAFDHAVKIRHVETPPLFDHPAIVATLEPA